MRNWEIGRRIWVEWRRERKRMCRVERRGDWKKEGLRKWAVFGRW